MLVKSWLIFIGISNIGAMRNFTLDIEDGHLMDEVDSGVNCLLALSDMYFHALETHVEVPIVLLTHLWNMTQPADEIQENFLIEKNRILTEMKDSDHYNHYQVRVISDRFNVADLQHVPFNALVKNNFYVLVVDHLDSLRYLLLYYLSVAAAWNPAARFLVLYNNEIDRNNGLETAEEMFNLMYNQFNVADTTLLYATNETNYDVFVSVPYMARDCKRIHGRRVTSCQKGTIENVIWTKYNLKFSRVPMRLPNCTFNLCTRVSSPFIENDCRTGLEMRILSDVQSVFGFSVNITCGRFGRGVVDENGTWDGMLGDLNAGLCDFVAGGFYPDNEVHDYFTATDAYFQDSYTWCVPLASLQHPWKGLITIFKMRTWIGFVVVLIITGFSWCIFGRLLPDRDVHKSAGRTLLNSWSISLGVSVDDRPTVSTLRILFIAFTIFAMYVTNIYTSNLIAVFTNPKYDHQIKTIKEVMARKLPFGGRKEYIDWFEGPEYEKIYNAYNTTKDFVPKLDNLIAIKKGKRALLINRMYVLTKPIRDELYLFENNVFSSMLETIMKPGFALVPKFNSILRSLSDFGFLDKYTDDFNYNTTYLMKIKMHQTESPKNIVLTLNHLQGAFAIMFVGLIFSVIVFCLELFLHNLSKKSKK